MEPKTRAGYEAILDRWLIGDKDPLHPGRPARFANVKIGAVTTKMVQDFMGEVGATRAPNTARRIFGVLSDVMKLSAQRGYIATSPCTAVELPSKKPARVRRSHLYLEGSELLALADAINAHWRLPVLVAGSCGLRAGELWALRRRDVDFLHKELTVRYALKEINSSAQSMNEDKGLIVGPPKSAASRRRVSIPAELIPLLEEHLSSSGARAPGGYAASRAVDEDHADLGWTDDASDPDRLLFVTPRGCPVRHNLFYKRVFRPTIVGTPATPAKAAQRGRAAVPARPAVPAALPARLRGLRWHDLRHTCAALSLASPGANLATVKERLGHENASARRSSATRPTRLLSRRCPPGSSPPAGPTPSIECGGGRPGGGVPPQLPHTLRVTLAVDCAQSPSRRGAREPRGHPDDREAASDATSRC